MRLTFARRDKKVRTLPLVIILWLTVLLALPAIAGSDYDAASAAGTSAAGAADVPSVSVNDVTIVEGQGGFKVATFTLSLSGPNPQGAAVEVATADGTATSVNSDYWDVELGPVDFPAGSTTATVNVRVNGDIAIEPDETFFVNLSQPSNCTIADGQGVGTIVNDDVTSVRFSTDQMSVNEADGSVQVSVQRVGDTSVPFSVFYATIDGGEASEKSDYTAVAGTLRFEPGETSKTITVFITDDALVEGPERFSMVVRGPQGSLTNEPSQLSVAINSDDAAGAPNPVNDSTFFVRQHYRDFLGRDPDPSGLAFWTGEIEQCGADARCREVKRINVSAAFFLSIEFQNTGYLVERMYKAAFGDRTGVTRITGSPVQIPVPNVLRFEFLIDATALREGVVVNVGDWEQRLEANKKALALDFVQREGFVLSYPLSLTPAAFVARLNQNIGGVLTQAELDALAAEFGGAADTADVAKRASVFRKVAENAEFDRRERNRAFVLMQFFGYLQRDPNRPPDSDHTGYQFWLDKLNQFNGNYIAAEMVKAFISSDEYRRRFGQ